MTLRNDVLHISFFFLLFSFQIQAQINQNDLQENITEIKSIDASGDENIGFDILSQKIGDSRIVMLGEQTHGHGTTFIAKTRIIKYLVENLGFDVLAFESGFYEINKLWDCDLMLSKKIDSTKKEIYGIWSRTEEFKPLINYVMERNANGKRLDLSGFDCKHEAQYGQKNYVMDFDKFLLESQIKLPSDYTKFKILLESLVKDDIESKVNSKQIVLFNSVLELIKIEIQRLKKSSETEFWNQELKSLKKQARSCWVLSKLKGLSRFVARDSAMAENLLWLANTKFKGRKIIVWAASFHIAKGKEYFETNKRFDVSNLETMGNVVDKNLPKQVYTLGFISSEGSYGEWYSKNSPSYPINRSPSSLEALIAKTTYNFAFIDLRTLKNEEPFNMAGIDYFEGKATWNKIFDGLFYIRQMKPPTYIKK